MISSATELLSPLEAEQPYTISQINRALTARIERGNTLVWFMAEISNFKRHTSGHCYLKLKDAHSQIPAVIWRSTAARLDLTPEDGMEVIGVAIIRVYQRGGYYQLDIQRLQPSGLGKLYAAFEALKRRLEQEGLFEQRHKHPLPPSVNVVGVITSKTGAAIRDILRVIATRAPQTKVVLYNVPVQGQGAAERIAAAIEDMNAYGNVDCIITGRGGGSIEDLWAFNEEAVARAVFASRIPVISAVGHETDFTIADMVADMRAATPSAAAEMAVADTRESLRRFSSLTQRFIGGYTRYFREARARYAALTTRSALRQPLRLLMEDRQTLDEVRNRCYRDMSNLMKERVGRLGACAGRLQALSPLKVLSRGYAVVTLPDGEVVKNGNQLQRGTLVNMKLRTGGATAEVRDIETGH